METQTYESYLRQVRELALQQHEDRSAINDQISRLIEDYRAGCEENSSDEEFFSGELNFYNGHYEQALKHYLEAKEIPSFQFFCYRASSFISRERGQPEKALNYAQKALRLDSEDPTLHQLLVTLQQEDGISPEASFDFNTSGEEQRFQSELFTGEVSSGDDLEQEAQFSMQGGEVSDAIQSYIENGYNEGASSMERNSFNPQSAFEGLHKFSLSNEASPHLDAASSTESDGNNPLEARIRQFQNSQAQYMQGYLQQPEKRVKLLDNLLYVLNGWNLSSDSKQTLFTEESRKSSGGHYLRWNGRGIALNPGPGFLENFHNQGLCIRDIDYVIVTRDSYDAYADVKAISELNQQLNKTAPDRQIIHYYLHQRVCQELAPFLKPNFKQARNTIHKLEMFLDSPDVEKVELDDGIVLHYFLTTMPGSALQSYRESVDEQSNLGVRFELTRDNRKIKIGYLSGVAWSPLLAHHLGHCDLMLTAFGNTNSSDYSKLAYSEDSLGYHGSSTLLEELVPRLMLLTEFGGREGDVRIEVVKKMRSELKSSASVLLAADIGMVIDLNNLNVKCSVSDAPVAPNKINVVSTSDSFGRLKYLSSRYCA